MMNPSKLHNLLLTVETDGKRATDARRMISAERQSLGIAMERVRAAARSIADAERIRHSSEREPALRAARRDHSEAVGRMTDVAAEARRVAALWGVQA